MTKICSQQVLKLYKDLLRYGENLHLTDKTYFLKRIKQDFKINKTLTDEQDISYNFASEILLYLATRYAIYNPTHEIVTKMLKAVNSDQGNNTVIKTHCTIMFLQRTLFRRPISASLSRFKHLVDYSRFPVLDEKELEEMHVRGTGPGGQKVNKTSNCVVLKHVPTGILVKCHESRSLEKNQEIARSHLLTRIDNFLNGDNSVEAQLKAFENKKNSVRRAKKEKLKLLKEKWKEREEPCS